MQTLATGSLAERLKAEAFEPLAHVLGGFDHLAEFDVRRGIEVEHQPTGRVRLVRRAIPRMQLEARDLGDRSETLHAIDLQIGLAIAGDFYRIQKLRHPLHGMALEEPLAVDA